MKVILLTGKQWDNLEFILNRLLDNGNYFKFIEQTTDGEWNIQSVILDKSRTSMETGGKYVINATKLLRLFAKLDINLKAKIKARFNNLNLKSWIENNYLDYEDVDFVRLTL